MDSYYMYIISLDFVPQVSKYIITSWFFFFFFLFSLLHDQVGRGVEVTGDEVAELLKQ